MSESPDIKAATRLLAAGAPARQLTAGQLSTEIRETIARWLEQQKSARSSALIFAALADIAGEEIAANPDEIAQLEALNHFVDRVILARRHANRVRMGGVLVDLVVKQ